MNDYSWPKKGNKAFATDADDRSFHIRSLSPHLPPHADSFRMAAEMLIDAHVEGDDHHRDELFLPIAYLYRHSLELRLKDIVALGVGLELCDRDKAKKILDDHNLAALWNQAKKAIIGRWSDGQDVRAVESVINEFHQVDPKGQSFRYNRDIDQKLHTHKKLPEWVNPIKLQVTMNGVFSFLDGCRDGLDDSLQDMQSNAGCY